MEEYTIRSTSSGIVIMRGIDADSAQEAEEYFLAHYPLYDEDEIYASVSGWND